MRAGNHSFLPPAISWVKQPREQLGLNEELAGALAEKPAAEKEEAMSEAYTPVGTDVTRGVRLVAVLDRPSAVAVMVVQRASVSSAVRFHWRQQAGELTCMPPSASHFELSQQEPHRVRLIPAAG
jgi:hypothetical protein